MKDCLDAPPAHGRVLAGRLGKVGVWLGGLIWTPAQGSRAAAAEIERLG